MANDPSALDRVTAYVRFLTLASFYRDWCAVAFDERQDDSPQVWLSGVEISPFHLGQLVGSDLEVEEPEDLDEALELLMDQERQKIVKTLRERFGGESGLFASLWKSSFDSTEEVGDADDRVRSGENEAEILSNVTDEKMAGFAWISEGCPALSRPRSMSGDL